MDAVPADAVKHWDRHLPATCSVWGETRVQTRQLQNIASCSLGWDDALYIRYLYKGIMFFKMRQMNEQNEISYLIKWNQMWLVMPFTAMVILHRPYYSIATYIQAETQLSIIKSIYLKWFTICSQLFSYYYFFISAVTVLATSIWMICRRRDLSCKQSLYTEVLVNNMCTAPDYKNDLIGCIIVYAVSTIIMTACPKTQRRLT